MRIIDTAISTLLLILVLFCPVVSSAAVWRIDAREHRILNREKRQLERRYKKHKQTAVEVRFAITKLPLIARGASNAMPGATKAQLLEIGRRFKNRQLSKGIQSAVRAVDGYPGVSQQERAALEHLHRLIKSHEALAKQYKARYDQICKKLDSIIPPKTVRRFLAEARKMTAVKRKDRLLQKKIDKNTKRKFIENPNTRQGKLALQILDERIAMARKELEVVTFRRTCGQIMLDALADGVLDVKEQKALKEAKTMWGDRNRALMHIKQNSAIQKIWRKAQGRPTDSVLAGMRVPSVATQPLRMPSRSTKSVTDSAPFSPTTYSPSPYNVSVTKRGRDGLVTPTVGSAEKYLSRRD